MDRTRRRGWWKAGAILRCGALLLVALTARAWQTAPQLPDSSEINSILRRLSDITGFRIRHELPFQLITRDQINAYIKNQIKHTVRPKDIFAEELSLRKFGFVPPEFDLRQTTIDLLTEQAAAFYDFHQKKLFISDWAASAMRQEALVHELAHALADQNFNIEKYLNKDPANSEESLAREAVVEGQAMWLTDEYAARQEGHTLTDPATARELFRKETDTGDDSQYPVFSKAPLYLRETMLFPYSEGELFQQALVVHDGKAAFSEVFTKPPVSTSQIIHPDRYFAGIAPVDPVLRKPASDMKVLVEGVFGEEDMRVLLEQYISDSVAAGLAPGMAGGSYRIDEYKKDHHTSLIFASNWDSDDSATAFLNAYRTVLGKKWKYVDQDERDATHFAGKSEDGYYRVERTGKTVLSREGFEAPL